MGPACEMLHPKQTRGSSGIASLNVVLTLKTPERNASFVHIYVLLQLILFFKCPITVCVCVTRGGARLSQYKWRWVQEDNQSKCDNTLVSNEGDRKAVPGYKIWWIYCVLDTDYWCRERVISRCCSIWYKLRSYSPIGPSKYPCLLLGRVPFLYAYYADSCCSVQIKPWNWSCCNAKNSTLKWSTKFGQVNSHMSMSFRIWLPAAWHADLKWHQQRCTACMLNCSQPKLLSGVSL